MTTVKISQLPAITGANTATTDVLAIVDTSLNVTNKITREEFFKNIASVDINGGTIDGTVIGGTTPAAISGTTITGTSFVTTGDMTFGDNDKAIFGAGSDLQIYHDGSNNYIDGISGAVFVRGSRIDLRGANNELMLVGNQNGSLISYYDNAAKLSTTATGIDVTGTVTADGLTVADGMVHEGDTDTFIKFLDNRIYSDVGGSRLLDLQGGTSELNSTGAVEFNTGASLLKRLNIASNGSISFYEDTGTTPKFFWDASAEALGIGTSSPASVLHVQAAGAGASSVRIANTSTPGSDFSLSAGIPGFGNSGFSIYDNSGAATRLHITSTGSVGIGTAAPRTVLDLEGNVALDTDTATLTTTSQTSIATFAVATFDAAKVIITANDGTDTYITELLVAHDGTTAVATEYGQLSTDTFTVAYDVDISGGNVRILATPPAATSTTFKVIKTLM